MVQVHSFINCTRYNIRCSKLSSFRSILAQSYSNSTKNSNENSDNGSVPKKTNNNSNTSKKLSLPEPPTTCCMSGCANCVWIEYAQKLTEYFKDSGETARKQILDSVTDPNMQAFLLTELRTMKLK